MKTVRVLGEQRMISMLAAWKTFISDERGATSIEYALIAGAITLALVPTLPFLQANLTAKYSSLAAGLGGS